MVNPLILALIVGSPSTVSDLPWLGALEKYKHAKENPGPRCSNSSLASLFLPRFSPIIQAASVSITYYMAPIPGQTRPCS